MKCVSCGFENRSGINFCENCGEKLKLAAQKGARSNGRTCAKCGQKVKSGVKFCENCGAKIPLESANDRGQITKFCPECGSSVRVGTKYCENCGTALGSQKIARGRTNQVINHERELDAPKLKPRWQKAVGWGAAAAVLVFLFGFWSEIIPVRAIPITASPILANASNQLAALQANLPRPAALENAVGNQKVKTNAPIENQPVDGEDGILQPLGCEVDVDLSISNVAETHFFIENDTFNPSRLIYSIKNNGKPLSEFPYGFSTIWYVHDKLEQNENAIEGRRYSCSQESNETISCMAPDWRGAISARMIVFTNDPDCPLPLDAFVFYGNYVYPKEQKQDLCPPLDLGTLDFSTPDNIKPPVTMELDYCFNTATDLPPKTGFYDDYIMNITIGDTSYTVFPVRESNKRICYRFQDKYGLLKPHTSLSWNVYDYRCWAEAIRGWTIIGDGVASTGVEDSSGGESGASIESCAELPSVKQTNFKEIRRMYNTGNSEAAGVLFSTEYEFSESIAEYDGIFYIGKGQRIYGQCKVADDKRRVICEDSELEYHMGNDYGLIYFELDEQREYDCLSTLFVGYVSTPGITPSPMPDRCDEFTGLDISLVPIGWQKDGSYLLYFKIVGGIPGLTRDMPGDNNPPWKFTATINYDYPGNCRVETYNDRLVCSFKIPESYAGTNKGVFLYEAGCTNNLYWFIDIPSLVPTPTPTSPPTGCGPEPDTTSTDPAVVKKYHKWCTCKGGTWTSYPDGSGECSVHS